MARVAQHEQSSRAETVAVGSWRSNLSTVSLVIAYILVFQPLKSLPFVLPYLLIGAYIVLARRSRYVREQMRHALAVASVTLFVCIWLILIHTLIQPRFSFLAAAVSMLTYAPLLFLISIPWSLLEQSRRERQQFLNFAAWMLLAQSVVGIVQGVWSYSRTGTFLGSTGDAVEGTIHVAFAPSGTFANPMFAANVAFLLLILLPQALLHVRSRLLIAAVTTGSLALTLASVVHILLFFGVAVAVGGLAVMSRQHRKVKLRAALFALVGVLCAAALIGPNVLTVPTFTSMFLEGNLPRAEALDNALFEVPRDYPYAPLLGLGPGQFSSRAGMATAGVYATDFGVQALVADPTAPQRQFLISPYLRSRRGHPLGSTGQPLSSWLSLYTEFGAIVVMFLLLWGVTSLLRRTRTLLASRAYTPAWTLLSAATLFFLMGFQENYWETAQAVMIGVLAIKCQPSLQSAYHTTAQFS